MKLKTWTFFCPMPPDGCGNIVIYKEDQKKSDICPYCSAQMEYKGMFEAEKVITKSLDFDQ